MRPLLNGGTLGGQEEHTGVSHDHDRDHDATIEVALLYREVQCSMISITVQLAPFPAEFRERLAELIRTIFGRDDPADLAWRLSRLPDASVTVAHTRESLVGFKLGYAVTSTRYYSWLGGVHPDFRRQGIASQLMEAQHRWVRAAGFSAIETGTTPDNAAMLTLNLGFGFAIIGGYTRHGRRVLLAKDLSTTDS